jgi:mono/diheme cytochrome c family protein
VKLAESASDWRARLHALWTLDGLDAIEPAMVTRALEDPSRDVRASAIRIAERWLGEANHAIHGAVLKRLDDRDWAVRRQLAASIGVLPVGQREAAAVSFFERHASDPIAVDALLSGLRGSEPAVLEKLLGAEQTAERDAAIAMLAATIVRSGQDTAIQNLLASIGDANRAAWQRTAMLRGAEGALLGAALPGSPGRGRSSMALPGAPCPTCPGGRAGPGGAYAFPRPEGLGSGQGRGGATRVRLNREPTALTGLAAAQSDLAPRATALLERISWPGKPGEEAVAPLTPDEQRRYEAGGDVYRNVCQSCHQPDGRGQDRIAPSLIGSSLALGPPEITARVLLNGKEGSIGLMPPIGAAITDDQIASVLTYIRREWGQTGSPVDPATISGVRKLTADRTRPWTDAELKVLQK